MVRNDNSLFVGYQTDQC